MNVEVNRQQLLAVLLLVVFSASLAYASYMFYVGVAMKERDEAVANLQTEKQLLVATNERLKSEKHEAVQTAAQLQRQLPVKEQMPLFLLAVEQAETVSGAAVQSISTLQSNASQQGSPTELSFQYGDTNPAQDGKQDANSETKQDVTKGETIRAPQGLGQISIDLAVEADNYQQMEKFVTTLEQSERIIVVTQYSFAGHPEITSVEEEVGKLQFNVSVMTFYYPELVGLQQSLPRLTTPEPSNKVNPMPNEQTGVDVTELPQRNATVATVPRTQTTTKKEKVTGVKPKVVEPKVTPKPSVVEKQPTKPKFIIHVVQQGETLYSISNRYFGSRDGEILIKKWNAIENDNVVVGQQLKILAQ